MRLLVTGAGGQLGKELVARAYQRGITIQGVTRAQLDISDGDAVRQWIARSPVDAVINAAAYTNVDGAQAASNAAYAINRDGVGYLAQACKAVGALLVHVSTDYVFNGAASGPYREDDPTCPLNVYGASKLAGEEVLREHLARHAIVRTSWVFSPQNGNFLTTILRLARDRERLTIVADQHGMPTYAGDLAALLLGLAEHLFSSDSDYGTYHYAGSPVTSWHGFATEICAQARRLGPLKVRELAAVTSADYPTAAARPAHSALDCARLQALGFEIRPWSKGLADALAGIMP